MMDNHNEWYRLPPRNVIVAISIIMVSTFFDALRDGGGEYWSWIAWHSVKWMSFYLPLAFIALEHVRPRKLLWIVVPGAWMLWSLALELTPAGWHGSFIQILILIKEAIWH